MAGPVVLADEIPVQVDVVELVAGDRLQDQGKGRMGGEAHMADPAGLLPAAGHRQAAAGPQRLIEQLRGVEAMDGQQIDPAPAPIRPPRAVKAQPLEAGAQVGLEGGRIGGRGHLGLEDPPGIRQPGQQPAQLPLRSAVVAGRLDVVQPRRHGGLQRGLQIRLAAGLHRLGGQVAPALLEAHPPQGEHRHGQSRAAETPGGDGHGAGGTARGRVRRRPWDGSPRGWISCSSSWAFRAGSCS